MEYRLDTWLRSTGLVGGVTEPLTTRWERLSVQQRDLIRMLSGIGLLLAAWRFSILVYSMILGRVGGAEPWPEAYAGMGTFRFSVRHDAEWYLRIAQDGYSHAAGEASSIAFFPGFPLLISFANALLPGSDVFAALIVVHLALGGAMVYVYKMTRLDWSDRVAWWTLGLLVMFPWAIYFSAVYPQSVLLLALAGAMYHARQGHWWRAGGFGVVAGATSLAGMTLIVPLAIELRQWARQRTLRPRDVLPVALAPIGGIAYFTYLWSEYGGLGVYLDSLREWDRWDPSSLIFSGTHYLREYRDPFIGLVRPLSPAREVYIGVELTWIALFLTAGALLWWKGRPSYGALVVLMTIVPVLVGTRLGIGGQVAVLFPAFMLAARIQHEGVRMTLSIILTLGLCLTTLLFVQGIWPG